MKQTISIFAVLTILISTFAFNVYADGSTKTCEKCHRDENGKMVCEPVPCK